MSRKLGQKQPEMINRKFGQLLVLSYDEETSEQKKRAYYLCQCNCGAKKILSGNTLRTGRTKSCGRCQIGRKRLEMIGRRFGRLLVLSYDEEKSNQTRRAHYLCRCDCGIEKIIGGNSLKKGVTKSCGCLNLELCKTRNQTGKNNPNYCHGFSYEAMEFRKRINIRDKVCQHSGEHKGRLEAHHLDGDHDNNHLENGELLCRYHHIIVTHNGNVWRP